MLDSLLALSLFGGFLWFALIVGAYIIGLFISDYYENGYYATALSVVLIGIFYYEGTIQFWNHISWLTILGYLLVGFIFSIIRTFIFGRKEHVKFLNKEKEWGEKLEQLILNYKEKNPKADDKTIEEVMGNYVKGRGSWDTYEKVSIKKHVFRWWFLWPVSLLTWLLTDLVKDLYEFVWDKLKNFYAAVIKYAESTVKL